MYSLFPKHHLRGVVSQHLEGGRTDSFEVVAGKKCIDTYNYLDKSKRIFLT